MSGPTCFCTPALAFEAQHSLTIINSYKSNMAWVMSAQQAILSEFGDEYDIWIFDMDTKRIPRDDFESTAQEALEFIRETRPRLVFLSDDNALALLGEPLADMGIPCVYYGINSNPRNYLSPEQMEYATGVLERPLFIRSLLIMKTLLPHMHKVMILMDDSTTSRIIFREVFDSSPELVVGGLHIDVALVSRWNDWQQEVLSLADNGYDALVSTLMHTIRDGGPDIIVGFDTVAIWTSSHSPVPVFGCWSTDIGIDRAIGGLVLQGRDQGIEAAHIAREILSGVSPGDIPPVIAQRGIPLFSRTQLERWSLNLPSELEQDAVILP